MNKILCAIDTETQGLNAQAFIAGCILTDKYKKEEIFFSKEDMWKRLEDLGRQEQKRKKCLNVYAHNMEFDFYGIAPLEDKRIKIFCTKPFIASLEENGREIIKFYDTLAIYPMSLKEMGKIIGLEKMETPEELKKGTEINIFTMLPYLKRDTQIVLKGVQMVKERIKQEGVSIRNICTINQIGINALMQKMWKCGVFGEHILKWNEEKHKPEAIQTGYSEKIHEAYRAGRNEAFQTGIFQEATYIDINNQYGYAAATMLFPDLRTETYTENPNEEILKKIGIANVLIENINDEYGTLPIRTGNSCYYPKSGKLLIGTWTTKEIQQAIKYGWKVHKIAWSITYEEGYNILHHIYGEYNRKRETADTYGKWFYKQLVNRSVGKMAQHRPNQEYKIDDIEEAEEYLKNNYEIVGNKNFTMLYKKEWEEEKKPYYMPIIPTLINAEARLLINKNLRKIPLKDLIYTDTDSIIFKGDHLWKFKISHHYGEWKVEHKDQELLIYSRKYYRIGETIKASGISKAFLTREDFDSGKTIVTKMKTIKTHDISEAGQFTQEERDLTEVKDNYEKAQKLLQEPKLYIDKYTTNMEEYTGNIRQIT